MSDAVRELKVRAERLHRGAQRGDSRALARLRRARLRARAGRPAEPEAEPKRRDCLNAVATELGFPSWIAARRAIEGAADVDDFGDLLCPPRCAGHLNAWHRRYEEAAAVRDARNAWLLGYRRQFLVVDRLYLETLGLDPDDPDWDAMGRDWVRPRDPAARGRLYAKLVARLPREG